MVIGVLQLICTIGLAVPGGRIKWESRVCYRLVGHFSYIHHEPEQSLVLWEYVFGERINQSRAVFRMKVGCNGPPALSDRLICLLLLMLPSHFQYHLHCSLFHCYCFFFILFYFIQYVCYERIMSLHVAELCHVSLLYFFHQSD